MAEKVTMKIESDVHRNVQMVKAMMGAKTFSETINVLAKEYIELRNRNRRK